MWTLVLCLKSLDNFVILFGYLVADVSGGGGTHSPFITHMVLSSVGGGSSASRCPQDPGFGEVSWSVWVSITL